MAAKAATPSDVNEAVFMVSVMYCYGMNVLSWMNRMDDGRGRQRFIQRTAELINVVRIKLFCWTFPPINKARVKSNEMLD